MLVVTSLYKLGHVVHQENKLKLVDQGFCSG